MIGLKRGTVRLLNHETEWEEEAQRTVSLLKSILGDVVKDVRHIGSTAIPTIKAKPIIDIAVAVDDLNEVLQFEEELKLNGFYYCPNASTAGQLLFACGSYYDGTGELQTHFIHVVTVKSAEWVNYINFVDYLIANPTVARRYEALKVKLSDICPTEGGREKYTAEKNEFITYALRKALVKSYLGKTVTIDIDRPIGAVHPKHADVIYPINYGYVPGVFGGDGEELDVYVLGENKPLKTFTGRVIGIVHRKNDVEDKLVAAPEGMQKYQNEIAEAVAFQERFYDSYVEGLYQKSCGVILKRKNGSRSEYLLLFQRGSQTWSFPKGHMEIGEDERQTAIREVQEETGITVEKFEDFREEVDYTINNLIQKKVVLFLSDVSNDPKIRETEIENYVWADAKTAKAKLFSEFGKIIDKLETL